MKTKGIPESGEVLIENVHASVTLPLITPATLLYTSPVPIYLVSSSFDLVFPDSSRDDDVKAEKQLPLAERIRLGLRKLQRYFVDKTRLAMAVRSITCEYMKEKG
jgi:hypothetical protein